MSTKTIAALLGALSGPMHRELLLGINDAAEKNGYSLFSYIGAPPNSNLRHSDTRVNVFELYNPDLVDGLIIPTSAFARFVTREELAAFVHRYDPKPIICIGGKIEGYPLVVPDYYTGMRELVQHMVKVHSCHRIGMVRGASSIGSNNLREAGFQIALEESGITFMPEYVFRHESPDQSGARAVDYFFNELNVRLDAIISLNDTGAISLMRELQSRGIRVPEDIIVVGYQGIFDGALADPPLTTMDEGGYTQGYMAAEKLIALIEGQEIPETIQVPNGLVLRESCGCKSMTLPAARNQSEADLIRVVDHLSSELDTLLEKHPFDSKEDAHAVRDLILKTNEVVLKQALNRFALQARHDQETLVSLFRENGFVLTNAPSLAEAISLISKRIGLKHCYLLLTEAKSAPYENVLLLNAYRSKAHCTIPEQLLRFPVSTMLPPELLPSERFSLVIEPTYFRDRLLGFIFFDFCNRDGGVYETLSLQFAAYFLTAQQFQEVRTAQDRYLDIAETSRDWIWEIDNNFRFIHVSDQASDIIGYEREQILGKSFFSYLAPGEEDPMAFIKEAVFKELPFKNVESWSITKSGNRVALISTGRPIYAENGKFIGYRGLSRDITEKKTAEERITQMAYFDELTGLPNKALLRDRMSVAISESRRDGTFFALLMLDLDRFKYINDTFGHECGDELLKKVADRIKNTLRESDTLARLGGDEFMVFIPRLSGPEPAAGVAEKIHAVFKEAMEVRGQKFFITASIGIALYPMDGRGIEELMMKADTAMNKAKEDGKDRYFFYHQEMEEQSKKRILIENELHGALERRQLEVYYQPQMDGKTRKLTGFEALLRWNHPEMGMVYPSDFIPIAEENGLIIEIGTWVFETALRQVKTWHQAGYNRLSIAINLSARQFNDKTIAETFGRIIRAVGLDTRFIELEITENALIRNEEYALSVMSKLKSLGVRFALDDFGTGYSSLAYLQRLPIDAVKIDKSFILKLQEESSTGIIAKTIIDMAQNLRLAVIAEGVETEEHCNILGGWNCSTLQGYYFDEPLSASEIERKYLSSRKKLA